MSDPASDQSALLLESILQTLKQVNGNILAQERKWDRLVEVLGNSNAFLSRSVELGRVWPPLSSLATSKHENMLDHPEPLASQRLQRTSSSETPDHNLGAPHFPPVETR